MGGDGCDGNSLWLFRSIINIISGNIIINKQWVSYTGNLVPSVGVRSSDKAYVIGYINQTVIDEIGFDYLLSGKIFVKYAFLYLFLIGVGWIVRNGASYLSTCEQKEGMSSTFIKEKAPRTGMLNLIPWHCY